MHTARQLVSTRLRPNRGIAPARWASGTQPLSTQEDAADEYGKKRLLCQGCTNTIAREDDRISIQGKHEHNCTNPHGVRFRIGCFREPAGGVAIGEETFEHTWFASYRWRIMLCARCGGHLGWEFCSLSGDRFCGPILDRLIAPH